MNSEHTGGPIFQQTGTIYVHIHVNILTKKNAPPTHDHFHEDQTINVASRVLTRFYYIHTRKNVPAPDHHWANLPTKFHEPRTINVTPNQIMKNAPPPGGHVFQATGTILELFQDIIGTNLLTKFYDAWTINVTSRVYTRKNAPHPGVHVFKATSIKFVLIQDSIGINLQTKFHEDRTINAASRVKNAPPLGSHVFQANITIFELIQDIIKTNLLTKLHEDWK
ncbi:hypothetical protein DPMN_120913 [Dreissena polymorpha]|uniref:Uncharacterized protein n=1 Tax=Dreissena polymorpha TaxID=45954 RepID=A0A9D4GPU5_DREPO|nr:hypothetical protein DPMN_120913 [Dreissena polymorpha]